MSHNHSHNHSSDTNIIQQSISVIISFILLFSGIVMEYLQISWFLNHYVDIIWYSIPLILTALPVFQEAWHLALEKDFFNELSLMSLATIGAWGIGEYSEGVGIMVFYTIGEIIQSLAVSKSRNNIKALLDVRPDVAHKVVGNSIENIDPQKAAVGDIIEVYTGEKIPLDGILLNQHAFFNTAAITGEAIPRNIKESEEVLAGMISSEQTVQIKVTKSYENSTLARILKMVEEAANNKSSTELFIRKFARIYTPIVFGLATLVIIIPFFVLGTEYIFKDWLYRSLIFLVLSCPCALVISVPLGYFGGIGLGSKNGILFKGSNFLEAILSLKVLVTDKTGTLTKGVFQVQKVLSDSPEEMLSYLTSLEKHSTHPIAKAIVEYSVKNNVHSYNIDKVKEIAGHGLQGEHNNHIVLAGNAKLMKMHNITIDSSLLSYAETVIFTAYNNKFIGAVVVADEIKQDSYLAIEQLHQEGVRVIMLSGDKQNIADSVSTQLNIDEAYGELLPDGKANFVQNIKSKLGANEIVGFVGDGINDAPVLALSDVGIAMGGMGSDLAVETADIIIQNDEPSKIPLAIKIAQATRRIVIQNIVLAMCVKVLVLILGVCGLANIWEAVFADVGVSVIAILNASRLLYTKFK